MIANKNRYRIGILFYFSSQWMGGIIYIINVIKIFNFLEDEKKPEIVIFYRPGLKEFLKEMNYPYLTAIEWNFPSIIKGNLKSLFLFRNFFIHDILKNYSLDAIFPMHDFPVRTKSPVKLIAWWADHQHKYYPEFFSKIQIISRNLRTKLIIRNCDDLVVSSQDVKDDFEKFFKIRKGLNIHIFHFVSIIDPVEDLNFQNIRIKYDLPEKYFMISNQFHKHKNHKVVLLALAKLKSQGIKLNFAFTGKFPKETKSEYLSELHKIIRENKLDDHVTMLGLITRNEQLQIMKHSQAVIQPSLFEGWSTVIEDAKSLQVPVLASGLKVNKEQLGTDGRYFDPHNPDELADILKDYPERNLNDQFYEEYPERIKKAAENLLNIFVNSKASCS